jgi:hypothetical protein
VTSLGFHERRGDLWDSLVTVTFLRRDFVPLELFVVWHVMWDSLVTVTFLKRDFVPLELFVVWHVMWDGLGTVTF